MAFESFFAFHCDPSEWIELRRLLEKGLGDIPTSEWHPGVGQANPENPLGEREHYRSEIRKAFAPYWSEVCAACGDRFLGGAWPAMAPPVAFWAGVSVRQALCSTHALWFVYAACPQVGDNEYATVFSFPDASVKDVAAWFTSEWWSGPGMENYLSRATSDAAIFAHQFKH